MKHFIKLSLLLLPLMLPATASAYDFEVVGIYYSLSGDNQVYVTDADGKWNTPDYSGNVTIPESVTYNGIIYSVTEIGYNAFYGCSGLTGIDIPNSVISIGFSAFEGCSGLSSVIIPNSVTTIGYNAFYGCSGLASVSLPNSLTEIYDHAFCGCSRLTSITIPNSVTSIGYDAFYDCNGITDYTWNARNCYYNGDMPTSNIERVSIGNEVKILPNNFVNGSKITSIIIPNSVTSIGDYAFSGCSGLTSVSLPNSVTSIGSSAFSDCNGLTCIIVDSNNTEFDSREECNAIIETSSNTLIVGCKNSIIPNSVTSIGSFAFSGCSGLSSVDLPNSVTSIGSSAFSGCSGLTSVDLPNSVTSIGYSAFSDCSGLTSVIIPNSVTIVGAYAFRSCLALTTLYFNADSCSDFGSPSSSPFYDLNITNIFIGGNVQRIPAYFANNLSQLTKVVISKSVTSVGKQAFNNSPAIEAVFCEAETPPTWNDMAMFSSNVYNHTPLYVPSGKERTYMSDQCWGQFANIIGIGMNDEVLATDILLNHSQMTLLVGNSSQLVATLLPTSTTNKTVTWTSSNPSVASVNNGLVTAVTPGEAIITATTSDGSNLSASCKATVLQETVLAESLQLNVTTAGLNEGATLQLTATVLPENSDKTVLWASNNPSVATVDGNGLVTTHSVGTATITAITTDGSNLSTTCTVTLLPVGVKGDVNGDSKFSISDVNALIDYLLTGHWPVP